jgi:hypothetical protein
LATTRGILRLWQADAARMKPKRKNQKSEKVDAC